VFDYHPNSWHKMDTIREDHEKTGRSESICSRASSTRASMAVGPGEEDIELGNALDRVTSFDQRNTRQAKA
jgi:hypothetical protein